MATIRRSRSPPLTARIDTPQVPCHITYTTPAMHTLLRANLQEAPLYSGQIAGIGPRYCPSIEDKIVRFADKERHQVFLEPEGLDDHTIYPNGISTSLAADIQQQMIALIPGLEHARMIRPGYAHRVRLCRSARAARLAGGQADARACTWRARSTAPQGTRRPGRRG